MRKLNLAKSIMSGLFIQHQVAVLPTLQLDATGPGIRNDLVYLSSGLG